MYIMFCIHNIYMYIWGKRFEILADFYLGCKSNHTKALVNASTICMYAHAIAMHVHVCLQLAGPIYCLLWNNRKESLACGRKACVDRR